jgi:deoxyadenosine/deoxycytidine kinase
MKHMRTMFSYLFIVMCAWHIPTRTQVLIMLEGLTGAGKTTFVNMLAHKIDSFCAINEPFDRWNKVNNQDNLFATFLQDQPRWAFTLQTYAYITHFQAIKDAYTQQPGKRIYLTDRSAYSGLQTFTKMHFDNGRISRVEWNVYQESLQWLVDQLSYKPDGFIYLRTQPITACKRAQKRNRNFNDGLHIEFFQEMYNYLEDWFIHKKYLMPSLAHVPVLIIDGQVDFESDACAQEQIITQINNFVQFLEETKIKK